MPDPALELLDQLDVWLDRALDDARKQRDRMMQQHYSQAELSALVQKKRQELARYIGVVDERQKIHGLDLIGSMIRPSRVAGTDTYDIRAVRWPVLDGIDGEGLWVEPKTAGVARVIAIPDADQTPAAIAGVGGSLSTHVQFARRFAEAGCEVMIPFLINRDCTWSGHPDIRMTNQPHREYVYRMTFQMGRHIIGFEVQKVLALVDYFIEQDPAVPVLVFGYGEGGLLALHSGALDERIDGVGVSGYFGDRFRLFEEPIYRNVWRQLRGFSDAQLASMVAPRTLVVETTSAPYILGPPTPHLKRSGAAPGKITTPKLDDVKAEVALASHAFQTYGAPDQLKLIQCSKDNPGPGTVDALITLLRSVGVHGIKKEEIDRTLPLKVDHDPEPTDAQTKRQLKQMTDYAQKMWRTSAAVRDGFWANSDVTSLETWEKSIKKYRKYFSEEVIGRAPKPDRPPNPQLCLIEETPNYDVYEVRIEIWEGLSAFSYLLLPKGIAIGQKRPVVVCQHGLGGDPAAVLNNKTYKSVGRQLAEMGYVVVAPQSPFVGPAGDRFRVLQRKANPLGLSLFSFFVEIHRQWLTWLQSLSYVDSDKIGFYGLSYGGKTAMRVPALLTDYAWSICSGDYNEWIMKTVSDTFFSSYVFTGEYEIWEFDLGHTFNYAEMTNLIAPRPFMVERGTTDGCSTDEWVAFEYAKAHRTYLKLGITHRIDLEIFDGGHEINFQGTKRFIQQNAPIDDPVAGNEEERKHDDTTN